MYQLTHSFRLLRANIQYAPSDEKGGMFMYSDFTQLGADDASDGAQMIMWSEYLNERGGQPFDQACFTYSYLPLSFPRSATFEILLIDATGNYHTIRLVNIRENPVFSTPLTFFILLQYF